jgi:hypothetical protein
MSTAADRDYLLTVESVREQANHVYKAAVAGQLNNLDYHASKLDATADYVVSLILVWFRITRCDAPRLTQYSVTASPKTLTTYHLTDDGSTSTLEASLD